ncbi:hypothetical protein PUNSTDRAFT_93924 [Punctularia strigosozonata HHB-11173 SS5]|uniref:YMC020W-like alpha/beta hydrolase domain-containing protein n=1 Tax=Punctularia strigosozonata (strain HHB-11173) TaxID=741275 RepID=R7RZM1_PUNST|nr:uncharacterized protein PUNSTDRAFT_93924 [Punctularia strigosozonata HHB-11173 SS5]EIN03565.1 hypothetical protein PUNSTDRAFT_93924 [Punctularia strigosozonata HHB-11173 SS5]
MNIPNVPANDNSHLNAPPSRRSSIYSTAAPRRPLRRPPSIRSLGAPGGKSRAAAPPSVSLVFAQPELGKGLKSAVDHLPTIERTPSQEGVEEEEEADMKRGSDVVAPGEEDEGSKRLKVADDASAGATTGDMQVDPPAAAAPAPVDVQATDTATAAAGAAPTDAPSTSPSKSSAIASWFGSISRSKSKERAPIAVAPTPATAEQQTAAESTETAARERAATSDTVPASSERAAAAAAPAPAVDLSASPETSPSPPRWIPSSRKSHARKKSWLSITSTPSSSPTPHNQHPQQPQTQTSPTRSAGPRSPPRPPLSAAPSIPSSIDEEVPGLPSSPTSPSHLRPPPPAPTLSPSASGTSTINLNPTASRFTLSIPLLGRPKVPLERAVAAAQAEDVRTAAPKGPETPVEERVALAQAEDVREGDVVPERRLAEEEKRGVSKTVTKPVGGNAGEDARLLRNWVYVKLTQDPDAGPSPASGDASVGPETMVVPPPSSSQEATSSTWWDYVPGFGGATAPASAKETEPEPVPTPKPERAPAHEHGREDSTSTVRPKAASVFSGETARSGSNQSSWLAPWTWYGAPSPLGRGEVDAGGPAPGEEREEDGTTRAEAVKAEALAREEREKEEERERERERNPVGETIEQHRSGWASLFMSRAFTGRTITAAGEGSEGGEMEVMDVPDEVDPGPTPGEKAKGEERVRERKEAEKRDSNAREPKKKKGTTVPPLTDSTSVKDRTARRAASPSPSPSKRSNKSGSSTPTGPRSGVPNLVLPTWADTFHKPPRSDVPVRKGRSGVVGKGLRYLGEALQAYAEGEDGGRGGRERGKGKSKEEEFGRALPKAWDVVEGARGTQKGKAAAAVEGDVLRGARRVVVLGIHGWFYGGMMRTVLGEPTGTSTKLANMMCQAVEEFEAKHGVKFEKVTKIPLEGEGKIEIRVEKLYKALTENEEWMADLRAADVVFVATHSQGSVVSTHILDRLIRDGHIRTARSVAADRLAAAGQSIAAGLAPGATGLESKPQRVCCLALCGIHLGPLRYLSGSSFTKPYIQYFENAAAMELFEFQNTESEVSKSYVNALRNVLDHETKMLYVASLDDQVVPVYSGLFTAASHPLILRAIYIDGDAYSSSDFLSNLTVLLIRILNAGLSDSRLLVHLSEATAGSLSGVGHSSAYEELATFTLAVNYLFLTDNGQTQHAKLDLEHFNASTEQNDYEARSRSYAALFSIPWALRDLIADERVAQYFSREFAQLRDAFDDWRPKTTILRDIKRKLQPIQRLSTLSVSPPSPTPSSKL